MYKVKTYKGKFKPKFRTKENARKFAEKTLAYRRKKGLDNVKKFTIVKCKKK